MLSQDHDFVSEHVLLFLDRRWNSDGDVPNQCRSWTNVSMLSGYVCAYVCAQNK